MRTRKIMCHPRIHSKTSCINSILLKKIKKKLTPSRIRKLKTCKDEKCIVEKVFTKKESLKIKRRIFAPTAPKSWHKNNKTWLDGNDISKVMNQYEEANPQFLFIGPSPIDFDRKYNSSDCVCNNLYNFSITKCFNKKKTQIGIIFNTDPITKQGKHWIAMFIDLSKKFIFFFDSNGTKMPQEVKVFRDRVQKDALSNNIKLKYISNFQYPHQTTDGQCGMYSLYVIIQLISTRSPYYFLNHKITDKIMSSHRNIYYNIS